MFIGKKKNQIIYYFNNNVYREKNHKKESRKLREWKIKRIRESKKFLSYFGMHVSGNVNPFIGFPDSFS